MPESSDRERLTRRAAHKDIHIVTVLAAIYLGHVTEVRHMRPVMLEYCRRKRLDLGEGHRLPAEGVPCDSRCFDAGTYGEVSHWSSRLSFHAAT